MASQTPNFTAVNHYVPRWYQHGFIPQDAMPRRYEYLDLKPERIVHPDGTFHHRPARRHIGPDKCFEQEHLYALYSGEKASDVIEQ